MSTAELTFTVGELAAERRLEARKIFLALIAALIIHLIIGFILAIVGAVQPPPAPVEEDKPVELTIVDTSPVIPAKPKNSMFVETDESRATKDAPKDKTFESNANSIAASEAAPSGDLPMPSQEGKDRPSLELNDQKYTLANKGAPAQPAAMPQSSIAPQPSVAPQQSVTPAPATTPAPTAAPDQLAMLTTRPTPQPQTSATPQAAARAAPQQPSSAYRPERQKTRIGGNISNRGISSVNALGTPLGRYQKIVTDAIGSRWYAYTQSKMDLINIGTLTVRFYVDRTGKIQKLKVLGNTSNEAFANICLQSILDANLPPIPDDVADTLPPEGLEWDGITFTLYPN
jgi:outer membrane biosynthesis protein TonB